MTKTVWLRDEWKPFEHRALLTPQGAQKLLAQGVYVVVEESKKRAFTTNEYFKVGCDIRKSGSWREAPPETLIMGLKELNPAEDFPLTHTHIHFAHCFKNQAGASAALQRFKRGKGVLYDLEFLTLPNGRRIAAFGYYAGFVGAALAVDLLWRKRGKRSIQTYKGFDSQDMLVAELEQKLKHLDPKPSALIMGAKGRCGQGAQALFSELGLAPTCWDRQDTEAGGPFPEILGHTLFINTVLLEGATPPFLTKDMLAQKHQLEVISDVSCDPTNPLNPLPIYQQATSMDHPIEEVHGVWVQAIDHLPSLLPKESSEEFEMDLFPYLEDFIVRDKDRDQVFERARNLFEQKLAELT